MMEETRRFQEIMQQVFDEMSVPVSISEVQAGLFYQFYIDLVETNKNVNLTAITEENEVIIKHFADSAALLLAVKDLGVKEYSLLDLGTGGGFPGIPLAILFPNLKLTLADSLNKRILFIQREAEKLGLRNINAVHGRAEDLARNAAYREKFDICVSRAVANLSTLSEYCIPFIHNEGLFIPYKSGNIEEELKTAGNAMKILGAKCQSICSYSLPEGSGERSLVIIKKVRTTGMKYPRKAGTPSKSPL